jgi:hypothetical protein
MPQDAFERFRQLRGSLPQERIPPPLSDTAQGGGVAVETVAEPCGDTQDLALPPAQAGTVGAQAAAPLTPQYPCAVCGIVDRWDDHGVWRCRACWPPEAMGKRRREG